jgi:hypothetical protein
MASDSKLPQRFPVRKVGDQKWEVLIATENTWFSCETERDARVIARSPVLEYESLEGARTGPECAGELDELADTLTKYGIGFGSRFFRQSATEARRRA